ncbi:MAG: TldD/PmbA family protein [Clostridia bacterium]|nr:TldD/PmbA family protein [Clostridia bacterium]
MLSKQVARKVLDACLETGADFSEIFFEDTYEHSSNMLSGKMETVSEKHLFGAGVRILKGLEEAYGYTSDVSEEALVKFARNLASSFSGERVAEVAPFEEKDARDAGIVKIVRPDSEVDESERVAYLREIEGYIKDYDPRIVQRIITFMGRTQNVDIFNNKGVCTHDLRNQTRIGLQVVAKEGDKSQSSHSTIGGQFDIDGYKNKDLKSFALDVCKSCIAMLTAPEMVGGVYPVIIHNGFGGVLFHEACGHSLEATSVAKNASVFSGKHGTKIASDIVTAIDDGTVYNEWGSLNVDDEGHPTQKNVLIKDGVLTSYMIDYANSRRMGMESTGNSRRESYRFSPTSRMTNTYIANGKSTLEEIIATTELGLFAKEMGGGSVNPVTGEFNFAVNEGYMVEHGKITHPVRGATLIGNGATALLNIDMVANNQSFGHGMCGSLSGFVHANVGEPTVRIQNMTVGGSGGKE